MPTPEVITDQENPGVSCADTESAYIRPALTTPRISRFFVDALGFHVISKIQKTQNINQAEAKKLWNDTVASAKKNRGTISAVAYTYRDLGAFLALGDMTFMEAFRLLRTTPSMPAAATEADSADPASVARAGVEKTLNEVKDIQSLIESDEAVLAPWARESFAALIPDFWDEIPLTETPTAKFCLALQRRISTHIERKEATDVLKTLYPDIIPVTLNRHFFRSIPVEQLPDVVLYMGFPLRWILNGDWGPDSEPIPVFSRNEDTDIAIDMYLRMTGNTREFAKKMLERKAAMLRERV